MAFSTTSVDAKGSITFTISEAAERDKDKFLESLRKADEAACARLNKGQQDK